MAQPTRGKKAADIHAYRTCVAERGRLRAVLESFASLPPSGGLRKKTAPFYAESYWYCMGGITFLMFVYLTARGIILAWLGPFWWLTNPVGGTEDLPLMGGSGLLLFLVLLLIRVWATVGRWLAGGLAAGGKRRPW